MSETPERPPRKKPGPKRLPGIAHNLQISGLRDFELKQFVDIRHQTGAKNGLQTLRNLMKVYQEHAIMAPLVDMATHAEKSCQGDQENRVKLSFWLPLETWQRYIRFFQERYPSWTTKKHEEKFTILMEMAEKYDPGERAGGQNGDSRSCQDNTQINGEVQSQLLASAEPSATPEKSTNSAIGPSTPEKHLEDVTKERTPSQEKNRATEKAFPHCRALFQADDTSRVQNSALCLSQEELPSQPMPEEAPQSASLTNDLIFDPSNDRESDFCRRSPQEMMPPEILMATTCQIEDNASFQNILPKVHCQTQPNPTVQLNSNPPKRRLIEPVRILEVTMEPGIRDRYIKFFDRYQWAANSETEKMAILLEMAENHPDLTDMASEDFDFLKLEESMGRIKFWLEKVGNHQGARPLCVQVAREFSSGTVNMSLKIPMMHSLWERYERFFGSIKDRTNQEKLETLLDLAERHPALEKRLETLQKRTATFIPNNTSALTKCVSKTLICPLNSSNSLLVSQTSVTDDTRRLHIIFPSDLRKRFTKFFSFHGWMGKRNSEKMAILLDLAESHQALVGIEENKKQSSQETETENKNKKQEKTPNKKEKAVQASDKDLRKSAEDEYSDDTDGSWDDGVSVKKKYRQIQAKNGQPRNMSIKLDASLCNKYNSFFQERGWNVKSFQQGFEILLALAETHPDLHEDSANVPTFNIETFRLPASLMKPKSGFRIISALFPAEFWARYTEFFERHGWTKKTRAEQLTILLEIAMTHPVSFNHNPEARPTFRKDIYDCEDGLDELNDREHIAKLKDSEAPTLRLLKPDYYLKFSEEARRKCPTGGKRTYAAMANTRRHIVERRQLKQLIGRCVCMRCPEGIDFKSIKIKEIGFTIKVTSHCRGSARHPFHWASSAKAPHETSNKSFTYILNTVGSAAIQLSGNNNDKMQLFARVLNLTWICRPQNFTTSCCGSVVRKCFEQTQQEMLDTLRDESKNGQIVLAGDGQFDSPGSCASLCTYTLMALGVDEVNEEGNHQLRKCGYVISQAVIDRRHVDNKSTNMERVGLHWALQPIINAGIKISELVTDDHVQIVADFRKIASATEEQAQKGKNRKNGNAALTAFRECLSTALHYFSPTVHVDRNLLSLLSFYSPIIHSNDIWHKAKNLLKAISSIASSASSKEQQTYRRYAKMLKNYLWECAQGAGGDPGLFTDLWVISEQHLTNDHSQCSKVNFHAKTKLMGKLDNTTNAFRRLIACLRRVVDDAEQLCRFRRTGLLEAYNGLTLKYCPKRIGLPYDAMILRKDLAALDHNHHTSLEYKRGSDGNMLLSHRYTKATKGNKLAFTKEEKQYEYIGHLMAAILLYRHQVDVEGKSNGQLPKSANNPQRIRSKIAPISQSLKTTCSQWLKKQRSAQNLVAKSAEWKAQRKQVGVLSSSDHSDSESEWKDSQSSNEDSDAEWKPATSGRSPRRPVTKRKLQISSDEEDAALKAQRRKKPRVAILESSDEEDGDEGAYE